MCVVDQFHVLITGLSLTNACRSAYDTQLFCLYTWYLWVNDEILYSNTALYASLLMLCYSMLCLIFYYFPVWRSLFLSFENYKIKKRHYELKKKREYCLHNNGNRQHRTRMVCIFLLLLFSLSHLICAPRSVFMIWDFVTQYVRAFLLFLSIENVPKAWNWSQIEEQKKAFTTALTVSGPF